MATVTRPSTPLPDPGDEMDAEQVRDWLNNVLTFLESTNIDEANVDLTSTDGIMGKSTAQTMTGKKSFESTNAAAAGIVEVAEFGLDPASGTAADNDGGRLVLYADDDAGTASDLVNLDWVLTDASTGSKDSEFRIRALVAGTMTEFLTAGATAAGVGRVAITGDMTVSDDVSLSSDSAVLNFGADSDISLTHVADTGLTMAGAHANGTNLQINNTASDGDSVIQFALSGTVQYSLGVEDGDSDKFVINYGTGSLGAQPALEIDSSGNTSIGGTLGTTGAATLASLVCTAGATFGGGYGSTGATISTAGVIQADGAITSSGAVTGSTLAGTISTAAQNSITSASSLATVGTITSGTWSGVIDGSATMTLGSDATGDIYYRDASGFLERLGASTDGYVLTTGGAGTVPAWESVPGGGISFSGSTADGMVTYGSSSSAIVESTLTFASDALTATSTSADLPKIELKNTHADATAGKFVFTKDPGSGQGADNDVMGTIEFFGTDASNNAAEKLAYIDAYVVEADHGSEAAGLRVYVAENDATNTLGLSVTGSASADGRIDATIGAGSASVVTIPGNIDLAGDIDVDGTLEADAITLGGTALGSLYSPIAGSSSIVTTGALNSGSITSGFGTIDTGSSTITTTGALAAGATTISGDTVVANGSGLIVGNASQTAAAGITAEMQVLGTGNGDSAQIWGRWSADANGPYLFMQKSRHATIGSSTIVQDDDQLGTIAWFGHDASTAQQAAFILAEVDGTPGSSDMPGRLKFGTTADGANNPTERMRIDSSGNVGIGVSAPEGTLHVRQADSSSTVDSTSDHLIVEDSGDVGMTFMSGSTSYARMMFTDSNGTPGQIRYKHSTDNTDTLTFKVGDTEGVTFADAGLVGISDTTNANMNEGLTIKHAGNNPQGFCMKSGDVATGYTGNAWGAMESDDYFAIRKASSSLGGVLMQFVAEDSVSIGNPMYVGIAGGQADTAKSTSAVGMSLFQICEHDGSNNTTDVTSNGNLFALCPRVSGSFRTVFLVDEDGDVHYDGTTNASAWDDHDDVGLLDTIRNLTTGNKAQHVFGEFVDKNAQILHDTGVITMNDDGHHFVSTKGLNALVIDTIRQEGRKWREKANEYQDKLAALEARLLRLEA